MRKSFVICDMCETKHSDEKFPEGWVEVKNIELFERKVEAVDFCSRKCFFDYFNNIMESIGVNNQNVELERKLREEYEQKLREEEQHRQRLDEENREEYLSKRQEALSNRSQKIDIDPRDVHNEDFVEEEVENPMIKKKKKYGFF